MQDDVDWSAPFPTERRDHDLLYKSPDGIDYLSLRPSVSAGDLPEGLLTAEQEHVRARVDRAVEIARRLRMPLKIAAKLDGKDRDYFEREIKHLFEDPLVDYVGEIGEDQKNAFLGGAAAVSAGFLS